MRRTCFSPVSEDRRQLTQAFATLTLTLPGKTSNIEITQKSLLLNKGIAKLGSETAALGGESVHKFWSKCGN